MLSYRPSFFLCVHAHGARSRQWWIHEVVTTKMADFLPSRTAIVCIPSCLLSSNEVEQQRKSKEIDRCINREKTYVKRLVKILLLGAGESGKSTFLKQMRIIHGQDFDQRAKEEFRATIYSNVIKGVTVYRLGKFFWSVLIARLSRISQWKWFPWPTCCAKPRGEADKSRQTWISYSSSAQHCARAPRLVLHTKLFLSFR